MSAAGRKGDAPTDVTTNLKSVKVAGHRPIDFWIGAVIRREFKSTWFLGRVAEVITDEDQTLFKIYFEDCDAQEMDRGELLKHVIYHPRLDDEFFDVATLPEVDETILFSWGQQPRLGMVIAVDPREKMALTVRLWKPSTKAKSWDKARYLLAHDDAELVRIEPHRVQARELKIDPDGRLTADSQRVFRSKVKGKRLRSPSSSRASNSPIPPKPKKPQAKPKRRKPKVRPKTTVTRVQPRHRYPLRSRR